MRATGEECFPLQVDIRKVSSSQVPLSDSS